MAFLTSSVINTYIMRIQLYIIRTDKYPSEIVDPDQLILAHNDETEEIDVSNLGFITTLGVHSDTPERVLAKFRDWWASVADGIPVIELLTDDAHQMQEYRRDEINSIEIDGWTMKANFIAYLQSDPEGHHSAVALIKTSELITQ